MFTVLYAKLDVLEEKVRRDIMFGKTERIDKANLDKTHAVVTRHLMGGKDDIFMALNYSPEKYVDMETMPEVGHMSMSVGDILKEEETGEVFFCAGAGWEIL